MKKIKQLLLTIAISTLSITNLQAAEAPTITERKQIGSGGYTLWSDGYIEQWGKKNAGDDQVVFHIPYTDVNSISFVIQEFSTSDQYGRQPKNLPQINGVYDFNRSDLAGTWISKGY